MSNSLLVCLHGFAQTPESFSGLAPQGAVALALPGHGAEPAPESFAEAVERLASRIEKPSPLAGYSLGARLALAICLRFPGLVSSALLIAGTPGVEDDERPARVAWDEEQAAFLEREGLARFIERWEALPIFAGQTEAMREEQRPLRSGHDERALAAAMRRLGQGRMPSMWSHLGRCETPLRLLVGERDEKYRAIAERMLALAPSASLRVVPGAGHNLLVERPDVVREELALLNR